MEESLVKIADYIKAVGLRKMQPGPLGSTGYTIPSMLTLALDEDGWRASVHAGPSGDAGSIRHPKLGEALRRMAENLPPLPEK